MNSNNVKTLSIATTSRANAVKPMDSALPVDVLYLAGVSYCGSTLLAFLLNTHPQIFSIGEMGPYTPFENEEYRCSCGAKLIECPFILSVKDLMENKYGVSFDPCHWNLRHEYAMGRLANLLTRGSLCSHFFSLLVALMGPLFSNYKKVMHTYAARNEAFISAALEASGKKVFFDATKSFRRIQLLRKISHLDLKVLHLVRDPRGYVFSASKHNRKPTHIAAREWVQENEHIDNNLRRLGPHQWIRLRYEEFCRELEKSLSRLAGFAGVEPSGVLTDGFGEKEHHILGNNMRLRPDALRSVNLDEKWRDKLSADDLKIVRRIAGKHARKYGYDI